MKSIEIEDIIDERYKIDKKIDQGGFGVVYETTDLKNDNKVALKFCIRDEEVVQKRFAREIRIMENIDHPNVMKILDYNLEGEMNYFVMPLAKYSLYDISEHLVADHTNTLKIFLEVCKGLTTIHSTGNIHRDIKPQNILVTSEDQIVVSDFGLGKFEERDSTIVTASRDFLGTEAYAPPEFMIKGGAINADVRGDIYQLGKTLYFLLTGKNPFLIETDLLPRGIENIVIKATKPDINSRYASVAELADYIELYLYSLNSTNSPEGRFDISIKQFEQLASEGTFDKKIVEELLNSLYECKDDKMFSYIFDKIPNDLLKIVSNQFVVEFEPILNAYTSKLSDLFNGFGYNFAYAETIASKMQIVYINSENMEHKKLALKNIMISSYMCNRWAAMAVFNYLLSNINETNEAMAIAEMLKEEIKIYKYFADGVQRDKLHPLIQVVRSEVLGEVSERNIDSEIDFPQNY